MQLLPLRSRPPGGPNAYSREEPTSAIRALDIQVSDIQIYQLDWLRAT
jgi:hypothetical protein